ncbi:MAG: hypothetical protein R2705_09895 [Ilumatobacteraceae bacterium]
MAATTVTMARTAWPSGASEQFAAADAFEELAGAIAEPLVIRVPAGRAFADPVVIEHRIDEGGIMAAPVLIVETGADSEVSIVQRFSGPDDVDVLVLPIVELRVAAAARVSYLGVNQIGRSGWLIANQHAVSEQDSTIYLERVARGSLRPGAHRRRGRRPRRLG